METVVRLPTRWHDSLIPMRAKTKKAMRFLTYVALLCLELSLILGFYVIPEFQARNGPVGHWEMETPLQNSPGLWAALIAFFGLITLGNIALITMIWRGYKDLKVND